MDARPRHDGRRPLARPSVPSVLEYGGRISTTTDTFIPVNGPQGVDARWKQLALQRINRRRRRNGRRRLPMKQLQYITIPAGVRRVAARPTMRLALEKTLLANNKTLRDAFRRAGVIQRTR